LHLAVQADDYYVAGTVVAVALVNEGPAPAFFSTQLFEAIVGNPDKVSVPVAVLPESSMKDDLTRVSCILPALQQMTVLNLYLCTVTSSLHLLVVKF